MIAKTDRNLDYPLPPSNGGTQGDTHAKTLPLLQIIWRRRWTVILMMLLSLIGAVVYLATATRVYTSTSRLYVDPGPVGAFTDTTGAANKSDTYQYTQAEMLSSTPILSAAVDSVNARSMKSFAGVTENLMVYLKSQIHVEVGKKDDILSVSFDSPYPAEAAALVNAIVDAYVTYESGQKHTTADKMLVILQKEKAARDLDLDREMRQAVSFRQKNGALSFDTDKGNVVMDKLGLLTQALTQAQVDTVAIQREYNAAIALMKTEEGRKNLVELYQSKSNTEDHEYAELRSALNQVTLQSSTTDQFLGSNSPRLNASRAASSELQKEIADKETRLAHAYVADLDRQLKSAHAKQDELQSMADAQQKVALELNSKATEYGKMLDDIKRTQSECDMLETRIREIAVTGDTGSLNINILEPARVEERPSKPRKPTVLAIALMLGMVLGTGLGLTREWADHRLRTPDDVTDSLGVTVLGVVPHNAGRQSLPMRGRAVHLEPMSVFAEAFRTIRTAIFFGAPADAAKSILVTSPEPGDGKSTSASNLAIAMAQAGHRTILLDADFRKPTQHLVFEIEQKTGVNDVLGGDILLRDAVHRTTLRLLDVLPCGRIPRNPSEVLNGKRFNQLLKALLKHYDKVVIDSPPVNAVADASILAASADLTVLVLRAEKSTRRAAEQARDRLSSVGASLLGVVFNDLSKKKNGYYGGYGYYGHQPARELASRRPAELTDGGADFVEADAINDVQN